MLDFLIPASARFLLLIYIRCIRICISYNIQTQLFFHFHFSLLTTFWLVASSMMSYLCLKLNRSLWKSPNETHFTNNASIYYCDRMGYKIWNHHREIIQDLKSSLPSINVPRRCIQMQNYFIIRCEFLVNRIHRFLMVDDMINEFAIKVIVIWKDIRLSKKKIISKFLFIYFKGTV